MRLIKILITIVIVSLLFLPSFASVIVPGNAGPNNYDFYYDIYSPDLSDYESDIDPSLPWWKRSALDENRNGIFDSLEQAGELNVDIVLDYAGEPAEADITALFDLGFTPAAIYPMFKAVILQNVPTVMLATLTALPEVVMVEPLGEPVAYSDVATPAVKARESDEYSPYTVWEDLGYTGNDVNVAIMDTGIDDAHPGLTGKWLGGVDFTKPNTPFTPQDGTYNADDTNGHGTTCAGIATGTGAPEGVYMGAAPDARLVDIRIGSTIGYAPGELLQSFYDAALEGAQWAVDHKDQQWSGASEELAGIHILSLSWGVDTDGSSDGSDVYSRSLDKCVDAGIITIVAAGNSGPDNDGFRGMGSGSLVITIGATDDLNTIIRDDDEIASYSSRGPRKDNNDGYPYDELKPDVSSPGTNIMQVQYDRTGDASSNGYGSRGSGTSYATPNVVGVVALMREANPELENEMVKEILRFTSERFGEPYDVKLDPFWNKDFGWGIIDAYKAVKMAEELEDQDAVDVDLQCHIVNVTDNEIDPNAAKADFRGLAWTRIGSDVAEIDHIEVRVDDETEWRRIGGIDTVEAGEFINWTFSVDLRGMERGNHTLHARAISSDGMESLIFSQQFTVVDPPPAPDTGVSAGIGVFAAIVVLIVIGVAGYIYWKKKRQQ
jgi:serine protease AprX